MCAFSLVVDRDLLKETHTDAWRYIDYIFPCVRACVHAMHVSCRKPFCSLQAVTSSVIYYSTCTHARKNAIYLSTRRPPDVNSRYVGLCILCKSTLKQNVCLYRNLKANEFNYVYIEVSLIFK